MSNRIHIVILAAGKSSRMQSAIPKAFFKIAHRESCGWCIDQALNVQNILNNLQISTVIKSISLLLHESVKKLPVCNSIIQECIEKDINVIFTDSQNGTGDATLSYIQELYKISKPMSFSSGDQILILYGDNPLIASTTLANMIHAKANLKNAISMHLGFITKKPFNYGRLITDKTSLKGAVSDAPVIDDQLNDEQQKAIVQISRIVEEKNASEYEKKIEICNAGIMLANLELLETFLSRKQDDRSNKHTNTNSSKELYLTDFVEYYANNINQECYAFIADESEALGFNNRVELSKIESIMQNRLRAKALQYGFISQPETVYFAFDTIVEMDSVIEPFVVFGPKVTVGERATVKSFSYLEGVRIEENAAIGPFSRVRNSSVIESNAKIGSFVEVKNAIIGNNSKALHLSYIGDAEIGKNVNIGAGVVFCNYDGYKKHDTKVGDNAFVGSNVSIIAPRAIGDETFIAAGSTINRDIADGEFAIARCKQTNRKRKESAEPQR